MNRKRHNQPASLNAPLQPFQSLRESKWFLACWATYMLAYVARVNLSAGISRISEAFDTTSETLGIAGSIFFIVYAFGQLINGFRGDKRSPRQSIAVAMLCISLVNFLIPFTRGSVVWLVVLWGVNGYFQSWLWGPLIRTLSAKYPPRAHGWLSAAMSTSMVVGFTVGWFFLGYALYQTSWMYNFIIPAVLTGVTSIGWFVWGKSAATADASQVGLPKGREWIRHVLSSMRESRLVWCCAACFFMGLVREGLSFWMPVLLSQAMGIDIRYSFIYILFIPIANIGGIMLANALTHRFAFGTEGAIGFLFCLLGSSALVLFLFPQAPWILLVLLFACISAMAYGLNSLLLGAVPLHCGRANMAASVVGIFDFCSYSGASMSVFVLGKLIAESHWHYMALVWVLVAVGGVAISQWARVRGDSDCEDSL